MPRYAAPPPREPRLPVPSEERTRTPWSPGRRLLAIIASGAMIAAFAFNFVPRSNPRRVDRPTTTAPPPPPTTLSSTSTSSTSTSTTTSLPP